jgi:hypothetical protein
MQQDKTDWEKWAQYLQQKQLIGVVCFLLDAAGPFRLIVAQSLLLTKPFTTEPIIEDIVKILEDDQTSKDLVNFLKDKKNNG